MPLGLSGIDVDDLSHKDDVGMSSLCEPVVLTQYHHYVIIALMQYVILNLFQDLSAEGGCKGSR